MNNLDRQGLLTEIEELNKIARKYGATHELENRQLKAQLEEANARPGMLFLFSRAMFCAVIGILVIVSLFKNC